MRTQRFSDAQLIQTLQQKTKHGDVSLQEFCRSLKMSTATISRRFGSWAGFRERAGLITSRSYPQVKRIEPREIWDKLKSIVSVVGPRLTIRQFQAITGHSDYIIARHFGSWNNLRRQMGLSNERPHDKFITQADLVADIARLKQSLGRFPTMRELNQQGRYGLSTYRNRIGNLDELRQAVCRHEADEEQLRREDAGKPSWPPRESDYSSDPSHTGWRPPDFEPIDDLENNAREAARTKALLKADAEMLRRYREGEAPAEPKSR